MNTITSIIIDDEPLARTLLRAILQQYCPHVTVVAEAGDLAEGVKAIHKHQPQLIFLDIEMPRHSGLELLDFFAPEEINFGIIFITAYNDYAIQAFKLSAIDYLLKPIDHKQLVDAIDRFTKKEDRQLEKLKALSTNIQAGNDWEEKRIVVPNGMTYKLIRPKDIIMIRGDGAYSEIHLSDQTKLIASRNLKYFEELLSSLPNFFRSHKSYIVNLKSVDEYVKSDGGYLVLQNGLTAGISTDKVDSFLGKLQ